eukprot:937534_1
MIYLLFVSVYILLYFQKTKRMMDTKLYGPHVLSIVVTFICSTTQLIVLYNLIKHTKHIMYTHPSTIVGYFSIISYSIFSIGWFILSIYGLSVSPMQFDVIPICHFQYSLPFFFQIGKTLLFIFYIVRFHKLFSRTALAYKKLPLIVLSIFIAIGYIFSSVCFLVLTFWDELKVVEGVPHGFGDCEYRLNAHPYQHHLVYLGISLTLITDLVASVVILRLYFKNLFIVFYLADRVEFNNEQQKNKNDEFMKLIMKITNLVIVSVLTEYMTLVINAAEIGVYWLSVDHTVNVICICFSFSHSEQSYRRMCCCVHRYCTNCCTSLCFKCCVPRDIEDRTIAPVIEGESKTDKESKTDTPKLEFSTISRHKSQTETDGDNGETLTQIQMKPRTSNQRLNEMTENTKMIMHKNNTRFVCVCVCGVVSWCDLV